MWIQRNVLNSQLVRCEDEERRWLYDYLSFPDASARFRGAGDNRIRMLNVVTDAFPSGFVPMVTKAAAEEGFKVDIVDKRTRPCTVDSTADLAWLRDYQAATVATAIAKEQGIMWLPTGAGKTEIATGIVRSLPCKWLFVVHRGTLAHQAAERYDRRNAEHNTGLPPAGIIADGKWAEGERLTCATFQSLAAGIKSGDNRVRDLLRSTQGVIVDECFPAGTLVGGVPIESVKVGDLVPSFDVAAGEVCHERVLAIYKRRPALMVRVHFADGRSMVCTTGHPFRSRTGWVPARALTGMEVLTYGSDLPDVRGKIHALEATGVRREEASPNEVGVLNCVSQTRPVHSRGACCHVRSNGWCNEPSYTFGRIIEDRDVKTCSWGLDCEDTRWERHWTDRASANASRPPRVWLGCGVERAYRAKATGVPASLQDRCGEHCASDCNRSGWGVTQEANRASTRRQEGRVTSWVGVDRVEVLERDDPSWPANGLVYNLSVDRTETYVVEGRVTHNCHVLPATSFLGVLNSMNAAYYRFGLSGTPLDRGDKRSLLAIASLGPVIHRIKTDVLIERGVLARPEIVMAEVKQRNDDHTFQLAYSNAIVKSERRNNYVVEAVRRADKPCLVFVKEVKHGHLLTKMLGRAGFACEFVWGEQSLEARNRRVKNLTTGRQDVLVCSVVFQEGVDIPELRSVVIASGGKSVIAALQRIGRGMRKTQDKSTFRVYDIADRGCGCAKAARALGTPGRGLHTGCKWLDRHTGERERAYLKEGHQVTREAWVVPE